MNGIIYWKQRKETTSDLLKRGAVAQLRLIIPIKFNAGVYDRNKKESYRKRIYEVLFPLIAATYDNRPGLQLRLDERSIQFSYDLRDFSHIIAPMVVGYQTHILVYLYWKDQI